MFFCASLPENGAVIQPSTNGEAQRSDGKAPSGPFHQEKQPTTVRLASLFFGEVENKWTNSHLGFNIPICSIFFGETFFQMFLFGEVGGS